MSSPQKALITGVLGQDGYYLSKLLTQKGYRVFGIARKLDQRQGLFKELDINFIEMDVTQTAELQTLIQKEQFNEVYHLAAQSSVVDSFNIPKETFEVNTIGTLNLLESIRTSSPDTKFFLASSSEVFGGVPIYSPQNENTHFLPKSPYGVSKVASHNLVRVYRESFGLKCSIGILFNHESPLRSQLFLTKKVCNWVKDLRDKGFTETLYLGNVNAHRDWSHCADVTEGMWMILNTDQLQEPYKKSPALFDDYVIGTGRSYSIKEFVELALQQIGKSIEWRTEGTINVDTAGGEVAIPLEQAYSENGDRYISIHPQFWRPSEVKEVKANSEKIRNQLGWQPKYDLKKIIEELLDQ